MKTLKSILLILLIVLGLAPALAKITLVPDELEFFIKAGFNAALLVAFGVIQLIGSILIAMRNYRKYGAYILASSFAFSSILIFLYDSIIFGFLSLTPILMLAIIFYMESPRTKSA